MPICILRVASTRLQSLANDVVTLVENEDKDIWFSKSNNGNQSGKLSNRLAYERKVCYKAGLITCQEESNDNNTEGRHYWKTFKTNQWRIQGGERLVIFSLMNTL